MRYTRPHTAEGKEMWSIAKATGTLDLNSPYCYTLLATHFTHTSAIAWEHHTPVGFVSGYLVPETPSHLFIWQIGVLPSHQGLGIASHLILDVLSRKVCKKVTHITATISPSNTGSRRLFQKLSEKLNTTIQFSTGFTPADFPTPHEAEEWMILGPLPNSVPKKTKRRTHT